MEKETFPSVAGLRYDVNLSVLFTELPLLERPAAAREAGFDAVEFWWPFAVAVPSDTEVDRFVRAVRDAGVQLVALNFFAGDLPAGDRGVVSWPERTQEFLDGVATAIGIGAQLGCRSFNALYGNRIAGIRPSEQDDVAVEALTFAAHAASRIDANVLIEPLSGVARYPLRTAADAIAVIDRLPRQDNVRLLADLYHLAANADNLNGVVNDRVGRIGHVQIADVPGRHEPGTGRLDLGGYLEQLSANGYRGFVGLEYLPSTSTAESFGWLPYEHRAAVETTRTANGGQA